MKNFIKVIVFVFCFSSYSQDNIIGNIISITDGDTVKLLTKDSTLIKVRIANIDCPERKQPFSQRAKQFTSEAVFGKEVKLEYLKKDRYGRFIGHIIYKDSLNLGKELLRNGLAWHYRKYSKDSILQALEDNARKNKLGLWQDKNAIAPWEWRDRKKKKPKE